MLLYVSKKGNYDEYIQSNQVYTCRLYQTNMTPTQVKENYNTTLKYRSSF